MRTLAEVTLSLVCITAALYLGWQGIHGMWDVFFMGTSNDPLKPAGLAVAGAALAKFADSWAPSRGLVGY